MGSCYLICNEATKLYCMYFGGGGAEDLEGKAEKCVFNWTADGESLSVLRRRMTSSGLRFSGHQPRQ